LRVATKMFIGLGCVVECRGAPRPVRFEGQHRGCCDGCAWAARAVATLYGLRAPIAPFAHWPLPLASVMETSFLNASTRKTGPGGPLTIWRSFGPAPGCLLAPPSPQFQLEVGCLRGPASCPSVRIWASGWQFPVPHTSGSRRETFLGFIAGPPPSSRAAAVVLPPKKTNSVTCTNAEHPKTVPLHQNVENHCPNGFRTNAQATQAYAPRWEA
jgi:hypothetical protein